MQRLLIPFYIIFLLSINIELYSQSFPSYQVTAYDTSSTGYYFLCPLKFGANPNQYPLNNMILDARGQVVYYKPMLNGANSSDFKIQPNGMISYFTGGKFYFEDSTFIRVDSISCQNAMVTDAHDIQLLPNGHYLILGSETVVMDLSSYHFFNQNGSPGSSAANVKCGVIQELDGNKNVVFEWHSKDHYLFSEVDESFLNSPVNVDWTHFNAIEKDQDGNLLVSVRHFNEITKINRNDSSIIWRLGGKANQFNFINDTAQFKGQHDIRRIANGNITLFDNGNGPASMPFHANAAKEYNLDETLLNATMVWSFVDQANGYSKAMGNVQRISNGNTMINYGNRTSGQALFSCLNASGQKIMEITFDDTLSSYRSFNYPSVPFSFVRPIVSCYSIGNFFFLDAGSGYSSYLWSNGETTQNIAITATGIYQVFVPTVNDGFMGSEPVFVNNISNPCQISSVQESSDRSIQITPNPVEDAIYISFKNNPVLPHIIEIIDCLGRIVKIAEAPAAFRMTLSVQNLAPGFYFIKTDNQIQKFIKK